MADNPVTVNVNGFGRRRSLLATVIGIVAVGYLAALGWTKYGPARPTLDAAFARWIDNAAAPIVSDIYEHKGDVTSVAVARFSADPSGYISEAIRKQANDGVYVMDKSALEKVSDALNLPLSSKAEDINAEKAVKLGKYAKARGAQATIWGAANIEKIAGIVNGEIKYYLIGQDGSILYQNVCNNASLKKENVAEVTESSLDWFRNLDWPHRLLIWVLTVLIFPIVTIGFLKATAAKRSNKSNAFTLVLYTVIGAIALYFIMPPNFANITSTLVFIGLIVAAGIYNLLFMDFARKLEEE